MAPKEIPPGDASSPRRRHSAEFKQKVCAEIRSGVLGRRAAQRTYELSDNLLQSWLARYDLERRARPGVGEGVAGRGASPAGYEEQIAMLERKVGQLTMALEQRARGDKSES